jgi:hypothetical protein
MQDPPYGYCCCGCGEKAPISPQTVRKLGYVKGEPRSYVRNHDKRGTSPKYKVDENGCWLFTGWTNTKGYGMIRDGARMRIAHRVFYERTKGPIPEGMQLDHLCRVPACVNPAHLEPVTNTQNARRGRKPKLTIEQVREIRSRPKVYGSTLALAREFGVHTATITTIRNQPDKVWIDPDE